MSWLSIIDSHIYFSFIKKTKPLLSQPFIIFLKKYLAYELFLTDIDINFF